MNPNTQNVFMIRVRPPLQTVYRLAPPAIVATQKPVVTSFRLVLQAVNRSNTY